MRLDKEKAFTLIELLVVMALILILAGLILAVIPFVNRKQSTTRATQEIAAMSAALANYKAENGIYPNDGPIMTGAATSYVKGATDTLDARVNGDPTQPVYSNANLVLYRALSGDTNLDRLVNTTDEGTDISGGSSTSQNSPPPVYYSFPGSMLLPAGGTGTVTGIVDPFGYYYGYSTAYQGDVATNNASGISVAPTNGYNPTFDLWSTGGQVAQASDTPAVTLVKQAKWIYNWQNSGANAGQ